MQNVTPAYNVNICWRKEKLRNYVTSFLKTKLANMDKPGYVYKFSGKSENSRAKIAEHNRPSNNSAVSQHIFTCPDFLNARTNEIGECPTPQEKLTFIKTCFNIIEPNMLHYHYRKNFEAIAISLYKPKLNAQIAHRKVNII